MTANSPAETPATQARPRLVLCLSGGMDSCVCATVAARDHDLFALHVSYGQRTEARELQAARAIATAVGAKDFLHLRLDLFRRIGGSALTDSAVPVPAAPADEAAIGQELPVTYVPFRNANLLSAAVSWAETLEARTVMIGAVEQDSSGYPDCRPAFYTAFNQLLAVGTRAAAQGDTPVIRVETPLIHLRKAEIIRLGVELGAPFHVSWSCYSGDSLACGVCDSCVLRLKAFREVGLADPIPYADSASRMRNSPPPAG